MSKYLFKVRESKKLTVKGNKKLITQVKIRSSKVIINHLIEKVSVINTQSA